MRFLCTFGIFIFTYYYAFSQCSTTVVVPNDITICNPDNINLNGAIYGPFLNFIWEGSDGYSNITDLNPTVLVNQTTTYKLTSRSIPGPGDNKIVNGNFEAGNTGFSSQYTFKGSPGPMALWNEGTYTVANNPKNYHQNFKPCGDHSSGSGKMMVVNGAASLSKVWCQTVNILPNTIYVFEAWAASVENSSPAMLQFSMNGVLIGSIFDVNPNTCIWENFYELWDSGPNTTVEICVTNQNFSQSGNDFALDDIYFAPTCISKDSFKVTVIDYIPTISGDDLLNCAKPTSLLTADVNPLNPNYSYSWSSANGNFTQGSSPNEITVDIDGSYNLTVIDENNCARITSFDVYADFLAPDVDLEVSDTLDCTNPSVNIFATPNISNASYQWSGPNNFSSTNEDIVVNSAGIYTVTITNEDNKCTSTMSTEVYATLQGPSFDIQSDGSLTCTKATALLSAININPNFTYLWTGTGVATGQQNNSEINVSQIGVYKLEVTDANGCSKIKQFVVDKIPPLLKLEKQAQDIITCDKKSIALKEKYIGLFDSILWLGPNGFKSNKMNPQVSKVGQYFLTALDSNGCKKLDTILVKDNILVPIPTYKVDEIECIFNQGAITIFGVDSLKNFYNIATNESLFFNNPIIFKNEGLYSFEVVANNGCKDTLDVLLTKNVDFPKSEFVFNNIDCKNKLANVNVTTNVNATYEWIANNKVLATTKDIALNQSGKYYLTTKSLLGCVSNDSIEILVDTLKPQLSLLFDELSCKKLNLVPKILLGDTSNLSIKWQGPNQYNSSKLLANFKDVGTYNLIVASSNGCTSSSTYIIKKDARKPDAKINPSDVLNCKVSELEQSFNSISGLENPTWKFNSTTLFSNSKIIKVKKAGDYILVGSHPESGCIDSFKFSVKEDFRKPKATILGSDTINCIKSSVVRKISSQDSINVEWKQNNKPISSEKIITALSAGQYSVVYHHVQSFCVDSLKFTIIKDDVKPNFDIKATDITCKNPTASVTILGNTNVNYSFDKAIQKVADLIFETTNAGQYTLQGIGQNGCKNTLPFAIKEDKVKPSFSVNNGVVECDDKAIELSINTFDKHYDLEAKKDGNAIEIIGSSVFTNKVGTYIFTAQNEINGCIETKESVVTKIDNGPIPLKYDLDFKCEGRTNSIKIKKAEKGNPPFKYFLDEIEIKDINSVVNVGSGQHQLTVIDRKECQAETPFSVDTLPEYNASLPAEIKVNYGEETRLQVITDIAKVKNIEWIPSDFLSCSNCLEPTCTSLEDIDYKVVLTDELGCEIETNTRIKVAYFEQIYYPNIFKSTTSNFTIYGTDKAIIQIDDLAIYDRWGNLVFHKENFPVNDPTQGWDGTFNGKDIVPGVYVFYATVSNIKKDVIPVKGDVTLVR